MSIKKGDFHRKQSRHKNAQSMLYRKQVRPAFTFQTWRSTAVRRPVIIVKAVPSKSVRKSTVGSHVKMPYAESGRDTLNTLNSQIPKNFARSEESGYLNVVTAMLSYISESMGNYPTLDAYQCGDPDMFRFFCAELDHVIENLELMCPLSTFIYSDESWFKEMKSVVYCVDCEDIDPNDACVYQVLTDMVAKLQSYLAHFMQCSTFVHD